MVNIYLHNTSLGNIGTFQLSMSKYYPSHVLEELRIDTLNEDLTKRGVMDWFVENSIDPFFISYDDTEHQSTRFGFTFENEDDLILFKLVWR